MNEETPKPKPIIERATNYAFALSCLNKPLSFSIIREQSSCFFRMLPRTLQDSLQETMSRGVCPLDSEPCLNAYMFAYGNMHNAKLRKAYCNLSPEFLRHQTVDIVDCGCGQGMGCICYADFLRENDIRQSVRRITLIEPSRLALARAALHVSLLFPKAEIVTIPKGFDALTADDLHADAEVATLHILSNVLDLGDRFYDLAKFADLVADNVEGYNEFVCVEPLFYDCDKDSKPTRFFKRLNIEPYFQLNAGKSEFVPGQLWTCAIMLGSVGKKQAADSQEYQKAKDFSVRLTGGNLNGTWSFIETLTVEQFKKRMMVDCIHVKQNPHTGKLFFTYGAKTGAVSRNGIPKKPMLSYVQGEKTERNPTGKFWLLHDASESTPCTAEF